MLCLSANLSSLNEATFEPFLRGRATAVGELQILYVLFGLLSFGLRALRVLEPQIVYPQKLWVISLQAWSTITEPAHAGVESCRTHPWQPWSRRACCQHKRDLKGAPQKTQRFAVWGWILILGMGSLGGSSQTRRLGRFV